MKVDTLALQIQPRIVQINIITSYDSAIFAVIMDKPDEPIIVPEHHLPKQDYLLLKKVEF